jgi:monoamine oxidase
MCEGPTQGSAMLRPVGGMANIANAMARSLGSLIQYNTVVTRIQRRGDGARIEWKEANTKRTGAIDAPYVLITIQPHVLPAIDNDLSPRVRQALAAPKASALAKVAFQAERRFWELDDNIYGGISWTDHPITQMWYPSQGIHSKKGILVGAYIFANGETFAQKTPDERLELALEGGERLHKDYRRYVGQGVSISWLKAKYSYGATTHWSDEARLNEYPILLSPDGPYHFAGEYLSYINGWQEGALRSAHVAIEQIANRVREKKT